MQQRGVENPDTFIDSLDPDRILGACQWFDRQQGGSVGLLIWKIRQGGVPVRTIEEPETHRRPVWTMPDQPIFYKTHAAWDQQRSYHVDCPTGRLNIVEAAYPVATVECDQCDFEAGLTVKAMPASIKQRLEGEWQHP